MLGGKKNKTLNSSIAPIEEGKSDKDDSNKFEFDIELWVLPEQF